MKMCVHQRRFEARHRSGRSKWAVPDSFPDALVARAYLRPRAEWSPSPFSWSPPPLRSRVREFCSGRLGWTAEQVGAVGR